MCSKNVLSYMWHSLGTGLGRHCHMPDLCRWTYSRTVLGAAGRVTATQLEHLKDCIPGVVRWRGRAAGRGSERVDVSEESIWDGMAALARPPMLCMLRCRAS